MTGNVSIDISISNVRRSWRLFARGKRKTREIDHFAFYLEKNLFALAHNLGDGSYKHGGYKVFTVFENKKRTISVASVRDRVVHRLLYEYLVRIYDKTFIYDAWSCRKGKGLISAVERTQAFLRKHPRSFVWRADIVKFFDNVDHAILESALSRKITDKTATRLLREVMSSFGTRARERERE